MGNLKEVAYDLFQPSIEKEQENVEPNKVSKVKAEKLTTPDNIKQGRPITIESVRINFPLKPYPAQVQMMSKIIHSLKRKENAVLESPTGSGKSLALLCATLAWRQKEEELAIQKLVNNPNPTSPIEVLAENNNKREREDLNNMSNSSIDSDFQTQSGAEEKKPKYQDIAVDDISFSIPSPTATNTTKADLPRRKLPPELDYRSSLQKFRLENNTMEGYVPKQEKNRKAEPTNLKYETFNQIPRIFVGSRTHKQITQLVDELKENTTYRPRMTVLASREHLCVHPKVSKSSTKADDCNALLDKKKCIYAHNTHKIVRHSDLKTSKRAWDIEDLVKLGKSPQIRGCPYYASRKLYEGAEIIFCPYNYIIDPIIRSALDIQIKNAIVIIDEAHNIEDSSRQAGSFEVNENELKILTMELGQLVRGGVEAEAHNHMLYFIDSILGWIQDNDNEYSIKEYEQHVNVWSGTQLLEKLAQLGIKATTFDSTIKTAFKSVSAHATMVRREAEDANVDQRVADDLADGEVRIHQRKCVSNNGLSVLQALIMIIGFFFEEGKTYSFDYRMALIKKIERGGKKKGKMNKKAKTKVADLVVDPSEWNFKLCFWCLNPGAIFRQLTDDTHSVILTSGTLSPMNTFESELETKFAAKLEANHVISSSQVWVGTIPAGPNNISLKGTYTNMESFQYQDDLGEALYQILDVVPFGVLCFFSSYGTLDKLTERWKLTGIMEKMEKKKLILTEPRKSGKNDFEKMMKQYNDMICAVESDSNETSQTGALIFGVFRGKISEGIDFTDNTCRAVVSIGIPYPGLKDVQVNLKKSYNDQKKSARPSEGILSGAEWYGTQAYRAINQALGRCIRHRNDWGAIILLEERLQYEENIGRLSKWIKKEHKTYQNFNMAIHSLGEFASGHSRADAEVRRALVEDTVDQFLKTEETEVPAPINAFDLLTGGNSSSNTVQKNDTSTSPTLSVTTNLVPAESKITENIPIILPDDAVNTEIKSEDFDTSFDFDDIDMDELPNTAAAGFQQQQQQNGNPAPPPSRPIHTPASAQPAAAPIQDNTAQLVEQIKCKGCGKDLISGFAKDRTFIPNVHQFSFLSHYANNTPTLIELNRPGSWIVQDKNLAGGPLSTDLLPLKYKAQVDRQDKLCLRLLTCQCDVSIGVVICDILDGGNRKDMGRVFLWESVVQIATRKPIVVMPHVRNVLDRESEYIPSSQSTNMNDMFYNLP